PPLQGVAQRGFGPAQQVVPLGVQQGEAPADDLGGRATKHRTRAGVPGEHPALHIEDDDGVVGHVVDETLHQVALVGVHRRLLLYYAWPWTAEPKRLRPLPPSASRMILERAALTCRCVRS